MSHVISHLTLFPVIFTIPPGTAFPKLSKHKDETLPTSWTCYLPPYFSVTFTESLSLRTFENLTTFPFLVESCSKVFLLFTSLLPLTLASVCTRPRTESFLISALFKGEFSTNFIQIFWSSERHHHRLVGWFLLQNSSRGRLPYIHTWFVGWHYHEVCLHKSFNKGQKPDLLYILGKFVMSTAPWHMLKMTKAHTKTNTKQIKTVKQPITAQDLLEQQMWLADSWLPVKEITL